MKKKIRKNILKNISVFLVAIVMVLSTMMIVTGNATKNIENTECLDIGSCPEARDIVNTWLVSGGVSKQESVIEKPLSMMDTILSEGFEGSFPPSGWTTDSWTQTTSSHLGNYAAEALLPAAAEYSLLSPVIDVSGYSALSLEYWHCGYTSELKVSVAIDGGTFQQIAMHEDNSTTYTEEVLDLSAYDGSNSLQIKFKANNPFAQDNGIVRIDDIELTGTSENNPPEKPSTPSGPVTGEPEEEYTYTTSTTDPDGHTVRYGWEFNQDDTVDAWTGFYPSGVTCTVIFIFNDPGTYYLRVKAEDELGAQSDFSPVLTVEIAEGGCDKFMGLCVSPLGEAELEIGAKMVVSGLTDSGDDGVMADVGAYNAYECIVEDALQSSESSIKATFTGECNGFFNMSLTIGSGYSHKAGFDGIANGTPSIIAYGRWPIRDILFMGIINVLDNSDNLGVYPVGFDGAASGAPSIIASDHNGDVVFSVAVESVSDLGYFDKVPENVTIKIPDAISSPPKIFNDQGLNNGVYTMSIGVELSEPVLWTWEKYGVSGLSISKLMVVYELEMEPGKEAILSEASLTAVGMEAFTVSEHYAYEIDPLAEPRIDGPSSGETGTEYNYSINNIGTQDVYFCIDWGDGTPVEWTSLTNPAASTTAKHTWDSDGTYTIKARAMNKWSGMSNWATLEVSMPKNKAINTPFLQFLENLLQSHPHLFPILQQLLRLGI